MKGIPKASLCNTDLLKKINKIMWRNKFQRGFWDKDLKQGKRKKKTIPSPNVGLWKPELWNTQPEIQPQNEQALF